MVTCWAPRRPGTARRVTARRRLKADPDLHGDDGFLHTVRGGARDAAAEGYRVLKWRKKFRATYIPGLPRPTMTRPSSVVSVTKGAADTPAFASLYPNLRHTSRACANRPLSRCARPRPLRRRSRRCPGYGGGSTPCPEEGGCGGRLTGCRLLGFAGSSPPDRIRQHSCPNRDGRRPDLHRHLGPPGQRGPARRGPRHPGRPRPDRRRLPDRGPTRPRRAVRHLQPNSVTAPTNAFELLQSRAPALRDRPACPRLGPPLQCRLGSEGPAGHRPRRGL